MDNGRVMKRRATLGSAAVIGGILLIGTAGLGAVGGWALWALGLGVLLSAIPTAGEGEDRRRPRRLVAVAAAEEQRPA